MKGAGHTLIRQIAIDKRQLDTDREVDSKVQGRHFRGFSKGRH